MANIIKIKRGNGAPTSANLQDGELGFDKTNNNLYIGTGTSVFRIGGRNDEVEFIVGTQTVGTSTGTWLGATKDTALYEGKRIIYMLPAPGSGNATLNLTYPNGNTTGAKSVYYNSTTRMTTHFGQNAQVELVYHENLAIPPGSTTTYTGWWHLADYDTNTNTLAYQVRKNNGNYNTAAPVGRYQVMLTKGSNLLLPFVPNSASTTAPSQASEITTESFNPFGPIYYYASTTSLASNTAITSSFLFTQSAFNLTYSYNLSLTAKGAVYIAATPTANGYAVLASPPLTKTLPTSADGKIYIYLGQAYSTTNIEMSPTHPIYYYRAGSLRVWTNREVGAASTDVGTVSQPIYLTGGTLSASTSTIGTVSKPVYLNAGALTAITSTVGTVSKPVYLNAGAITAITSTIGSVSKPVYLNAGAITALTSTIGGTNQPVYLNAGAITAASSYADFVVEQGEATSPSGGSATLTWTYRKWNSGVVECWSKASWSATSFALWSNGVYEGTPRPWWNFPSGLFKAVPVLQALHCTDGGTWFQDVITDGGTKTVSAANTCAFCALRPNNYAPVPITTHLYAKGTWK